MNENLEKFVEATKARMNLYKSLGVALFGSFMIVGYKFYDNPSAPTTIILILLAIGTIGLWSACFYEYKKLVYKLGKI